jgi:phage baseplate assembly protein W
VSGTTTDRVAVGWRWAEIRQGDTLQRIAYRELGDAAKWAELANLNNLLPPYLTASPATALASGGRVLLFGERIRVFSPSDQIDAVTQAAELYGTDIALDQNGRMTASDGDFNLVSGVSNLTAALGRRVTTGRGELMFHPAYGSTLRRLIGQANGPMRAALAARTARMAVEADSRVARVTDAQAGADGDTLSVILTVEPISSGSPISIKASV